MPLFRSSTPAETSARNKPVRPWRHAALSLAYAVTAFWGIAHLVLAQSKPGAPGASQNASSQNGAAVVPYIDVHAHLDPADVDGSLKTAAAAMPRENAAKIIFMPSPFTMESKDRFDSELLLPGPKNIHPSSLRWQAAEHSTP